jgi:hypothetical protein
MESKRSRHLCICCKSFIQNQRKDSKYCRSCITHIRKRHGEWRTDEKREIRKYEEKIEEYENKMKEYEEIIKKFESIEKKLQSSFEGALKKDRDDKESREMWKKRFPWMDINNPNK